MSLLLSAQALTKSYSSRPLFTDISLDMLEGERLGLIGPNGSGKSTLLKILAGLEQPDHGVRSLRKGARLGYVPQDDRFDPEQTIEDVLMAAVQDLHLDDAEQHAWVGTMLAKMNFADPHQKAGALSGGWSKRLAIARQLIRKPDLLLLDEPTNHLDLEGILWLEKLLLGADFAFLLVSHDRYFLQNVTKRVVEFNRAYPKGYFSVNGTYADFLAKREELLAGQIQQQNVLANKVRREIEWLKRGPKARTTKSVSRIKSAGQLQADLSELSYRNSQNRAVEIDFSATGRKANQLVVAEGLAKSRGGRKLFSGVDLKLAPGVKIGLLGPNGCGKSTLLKIFSGQLEPDAGTVTRAVGLRTVLFDQNRESLDPEQLLRDALSPNGENVLYQGRPMHVVAWAKRFLFQSEQLARPIGSLSGGEQARVLIARLMLQAADVLLLDEPTNDLDIPSLEVLEESLIDFPGALVLVTHDRYLLDRVANVIVALDGPDKVGIYADLAQWQTAQAESAKSETSKRTAAKKSSASASKKLSYKETRELEGMEAAIASGEQAVAEVQRQIEDPQVIADHVKLLAVCDELELAQSKLNGLYARWEELEAKRDS